MPSRGSAADHGGLPDPGAGQEHGSDDGEQEEGQQRLAHPQTRRQRAVEGAGDGQSDRAEGARHAHHPRDLDPGPVEHDDAGDEDRLEHEQLDADGRRLAEEEPGRVDPRQAQAVPGAVGRLDRDAALDGEDGAEEDGDPEEARARPGHDAAVGAEGEGEQHQGDDAEGRHLGERDARAGLDAEVLAGHQDGVTPHGPPARSPDAVRGAPAVSPAAPLGRRTRWTRPGPRSVIGPAGAPSTRPAVTRPPVTVTARWARSSTAPDSWLAMRMVTPCRRRLGHDLVEQRPGGRVEPGVGLVEQPQLRPAGGQHGEGDAPALAGRELGRPACGPAGR